MYIYLIPQIFLSILTYLENSNNLNNLLNNKYFYYLITIFFILFIGFRYEIGCDWDGYMEMFEKYSKLSFGEIIKYNFITKEKSSIQELGHILISLFSRNIYFLNCIYATIFTIPLFYFCSKIKRRFLALLVSYPYYIVVVGMGPIRQAACISILMISILLVSKNKYFFHFLASVFSLFIHQFSVFFNFLLLIPLVPKFFRNKLSLNYIMVIFIVISLILYSSPAFINKIYWYIVLDNNIIPPAKSALLIWSINFIPSLIYLLNISKFNFNKNLNNILVCFSLFEFLLLPIVFYKSVIAYRLLLYIFPSSIYISAHIPDLNLFKINPKLFVNLLILLTLSTLIIWLKFAFHASCWVPYRNILLIN